MPTRVRLVSLALLLALPPLGCGSAHGSPVNADSQVRFGVDMAQRGLWSEAFFRFQQAQRMEGAGGPRLLNNLAVASEALGKFDQALDYYKQGLAQAPGDAELKANYDRFVSFYESFRARGEEKDKPAAATATPPAADSGTPAPSEPTAPVPPQVPLGGAEPPGSGPDSGPPDIPPLVPEPVPTPPSQTSDATMGAAAHV
jgi:Tetratricopeptide repeat